MTTKRRSRVAGGLAALLLVVTGCQSEVPTVTKPTPIRPDPDIAQAPSHRLKPYYSQNLDWSDCGERPEGVDRPDGLQCAQVLVPRDYERPRAERIQLTISRLPATGHKSERIGSLLINPGGPGLSGVRFLERSGAMFDDSAVRERFDLVSFDPRGVGRSAPVQCLTDEEKDTFVTESGAAEASGDLREAIRLQREFAEACERRSGEMLPHVDTESAARDLDVLRAVLGDRNLTYLGYSYGSKLGATYAALFPEKFRAMVLDGALDPGVDPLEQAVARAESGRAALRAFVQDCLRREDCPLQAEGVRAAIEEINQLAEEAAQDPLANDDDPEREVGAAWVAAGVRAGLYSEQAWPRLRSALADALGEYDGTALMRLAEAHVGRSEDGSWNNSLDAGIAIRCADWPPVERERAERAAAELTGKAGGGETPDESDGAGEAGTTDDVDAGGTAGLFLRDVQWAWLECRDWPVRTGPPDPLEIEETATAPVLVIGNERDPATPYAWAKRLVERFPNGRLLTYRGDGHGAYQVAESPCVDEVVDTYLIEGRLPDPGTSCPAP